VFRHGRRCSGDFLEVIAMPAQRACGRVGYVIGRRALPRAVDRNRVRRMLRETLRGERPGIERFDLILRLKRGALRAELPRVRAEALRCLASLAAAEAPQ
jgi:ribonuclease P protein component